MKCLVTGAGGFIGVFLAQCLLDNGYSVCVTDMAPGPSLASLKGDVEVCSLDVTSREAVTALLRATKPDIIFHLAAQSYPSVSWNDPASTMQVNVIGTVQLMEAVKDSKLTPVMVVAGSSAEYVTTDSPLPIHEEVMLMPSSPYGVSKLAEDLIGLLYWRQYHFHVIRVRPFFVIGPGKRGDVCSDFARGIVDIERGSKAELRVGNLGVVRDLLDIRDGVAAFRVIAESGQPGDVYNICSGTGYSLRSILDTMKGLSTANISDREDPARKRALDEPVRIGDPSRLKALGWEPSIPIEKTLADILAYWRKEPAGP
ncbi:MAG: GDP-mannose 4,6-dehydratase [Lentisphaerota bacterium]